MVVNSKEIDKSLYDPEYHASQVELYKKMLADAETLRGTEYYEDYVKSIKNDAVFDETGYLVAVSYWEETYNPKLTLLDGGEDDN